MTDIMHRWTPAEVYQAYVAELLKNNPPVTQLVEKRCKPYGKRKAERIVKHQRVVGGYWGKRNRISNVPNFWIYTMITRNGKEQIVEVINQERWLKIMDAYFLKARDLIIQGHELNMGANLGAIQPRRIERNHASRTVDQAATKKQPMLPDENGKLVKRIIYYTDDYYVRVAWQKNHKITNERTYEFKPSGKNINGNGFQQLFSKANIDNPALKLNYPFHPYIKSAS